MGLLDWLFGNDDEENETENLRKKLKQQEEETERWKDKHREMTDYAIQNDTEHRKKHIEREQFFDDSVNPKKRTNGNKGK